VQDEEPAFEAIMRARHVAGFAMPSAPSTLRFDRGGPSRQERERERKRFFDDSRGSAHSRGYDSKWRQARIGYLAKHPLCRHCEEAGHVVPATVVDHIIPHRGDKALFWDSSNWQPLCKQHHDIKTAREDSAFAQPGAGAGLKL
jgi:5-methylcytosine-specific restriction enzyme A